MASFAPNYRMCHRFRLMKLNDYFGSMLTTFESSSIFWGSCGSIETGSSRNLTTIRKFSLPKSMSALYQCSTVVRGFCWSSIYFWFMGTCLSITVISSKSKSKSTLITNSHIIKIKGVFKPQFVAFIDYFG